MDKKMVKVLYFLLMVVNIRVNSRIIRFQAKVNITGPMDKYIRDNGKIIK
jgi:hypothetical protein